MVKTKCGVCSKPIPKDKKTCLSCASSLNTILKALVMPLPLENHEIEKLHLKKISEYPEIVMFIQKLTTMDGKEVRNKESSITIESFELTNQIEDEQVKNSANRLIQLHLYSIVQYYEERRYFYTEYNGESLKLELITLTDMFWQIIDGFEFTERDIDSILSIKKPYDMRERNIKSHRLKVFWDYENKLDVNISRCNNFLKILKIRQSCLREKKKAILNKKKSYIIKKPPKPIPVFHDRMMDPIRKERKGYVEDYIVKINKFTIKQFNNEAFSNTTAIKEFSKLLTDLQKLRELMRTIYRPIGDRLKDKGKEKLFDILNNR